MSQVDTTDCSVLVVAPTGHEWLFGAARHAPLIGRPLLEGLLSVETQKDLSNAVGGFTLVFDARTDADGRTWAQRIPLRSIVFIVMDRQGMEGTTTGNPTVMVGLTDSHQVQESFRGAQPQRTVSIHGREIAGVLLDIHLFYHPLLAANPAYGTLTIQSAAEGELQMALTNNPLLLVPMEPRTILQLVLDTYVFLGGTTPQADTVTLPSTNGTEAGATNGTGTAIPQHPLIRIDLPQRRLEDLLVPNYHAWRTFEEPLRVARTPFPARAGSLWNYLHLFFDRAFQEFFTRIEDGVCKIHFRGKPFRHERIRSGTRFKTAQQEPTLQTLLLAPADIVDQQLGRDSSNVYNYFVVLPRGLSDMQTGDFYRTHILPQVVTDPTHPSFVGRYGLRIYEVQTIFLNAHAPPGTSEPVAEPVAATVVQPLVPATDREATYAPLANQIATEQGLPAALRPWFVALIKEESAFNPQARGVVLKSGNRAEGIAQWVAPYPAGVGLVDAFNPANALAAAARYWQQMRQMPLIGDDPRLLVAGYNAGPGAVQTHKGIPPFQETQGLVRRVEASMPRYQGMAGTPAAPPAAPAPAPKAPQPLAPSPHQDSIIDTAQRWGAILAAWHDMGGELFGGTITVRGDPRWNVGHRLLSNDEQGEWEAYIEGVRHRYDIRTGQYLTTLRLTRGWHLSATVAAQMAEEGKTTITAVSGGPPEIAPAEELPSKGKVTIDRMNVAGVWYRNVGTEDDEFWVIDEKQTLE